MFRRKKNIPTPPETDLTADIAAAQLDLAKAGQQQSKAKVDDKRARWTSESLRLVREQNHFAPAIRRSMLGEI